MIHRLTRWVSAALVLSMVGAPAAAGQPDPTLTELVDAAVRRLQVAEPAAAAKFRTGDPVRDPVREQVVLDTVAAEAVVQQLDPDYATTVFRDQIDATVAIQYSRLAQWTLDPADAPADAPDLASSRGIIDVLNREMITLMARHWETLHSPACPGELDQAAAAVAQRRDLDPLYLQAIGLATHNYCR